MNTFHTPLGLVLLGLYAFSVASLEAPYPSVALPLVIAGVLHYPILGAVLKRMLFLNIFTLTVVASALWQKEYSLAWLIMVRANAIMAFALLLFYGKESHEIALGMQRLGFPRTFTASLFLTAKSITLLTQTLWRLKTTATVRGFSPKTDTFTYRTIAGIFGALLLQAFVRARRFRHAIIVRGFTGHIYTLTPLARLKYSELFLAFMTGVAIVLHQGGVG